MKFKSEISILCFALLVWAAEGEQSVWAAGWTGEGWWSLPASSSTMSRRSPGSPGSPGCSLTFYFQDFKAAVPTPANTDHSARLT